MKDLTKPDNDQTSRDLRRYQNTLMVAGSGVMLFELWSIIKAFLEITIGSNDTIKKEFMDLVSSGDTVAEDIITTALSIFLILVIIGIDMLFRFKVYVNARREGRGGYRKNSYLVLAAVLAAVSFISLVSIIFIAVFNRSEDVVRNAVASFAVELTSLITLLEVIRSAIMIRKLSAGQGDM